MTPASKKKRLITLLGGQDKEKLKVDLSGRSRTSSLDSKRSSVSDSWRAANYCSNGQFPAVREYDAMGYLEPRPRHLPTYLTLLNHAPELDLPAFQEARSKSQGQPGGRSELPPSLASRGNAQGGGDAPLPLNLSDKDGSGYPGVGEGVQAPRASAFHAVGPYSRQRVSGAGSKGVATSSGKGTLVLPSNVVYSAVTSSPRDCNGLSHHQLNHHRLPSSASTPSVDDMEVGGGSVSSGGGGGGERRRRGSSSSSTASFRQNYGVVSVQDPGLARCCPGDRNSGGGGVPEERLVVDLTDLSRIKAAQRKFSDQDLYSSPHLFHHRNYPDSRGSRGVGSVGGGGGGSRRLSSTSSSLSDHPYSRCIVGDLPPGQGFNNISAHNNINNNAVSSSYSLASTTSRGTTPVPAHRERDRHFSGPDFNLNTSYCSSSTRGSKPPPSLPSVWASRSASESDSVFEEEFRCNSALPSPTGVPPPYVNMQNGPRLRGQVYPEAGGVLAGFDIAQASLV